MSIYRSLNAIAGEHAFGDLLGKVDVILFDVISAFGLLKTLDDAIKKVGGCTISELLMISDYREFIEVYFDVGV